MNRMKIPFPAGIKRFTPTFVRLPATLAMMLMLASSATTAAEPDQNPAEPVAAEQAAATDEPATTPPEAAADEPATEPASETGKAPDSNDDSTGAANDAEDRPTDEKAAARTSDRARADDPVARAEAAKIREEALGGIRNRPLSPAGYPKIEHDGYFRLRMDGFYRPHLGTTAYDNRTQKAYNSSAYPSPITENYINKDRLSQEDWLSSMNIRFRWIPTIHVMKNIAIVAQFDVLDNLILGSTPDSDADRPDAPLSIFARSQAVPDESVKVKQAYMIWSPFNPDNTKDFLLSISAGRMARHWGLGTMDNDGGDIDADFGTYVDRVNVLARYWNVYLELGFGWTATGATSATDIQAYGQPYDLTNSDNVFDFTASIFQKPMTMAGRLQRADRLVSGKPVFDWGVYVRYRWQKTDSKQKMDDALAVTPEADYDGYELEERDAWTVSPNLWMKFEWKHSSKERLRLEVEANGMFGHIGRTPRFRFDSTLDQWLEDGHQSLDIRSWAVAFEGEYQWGPVNVGLLVGAASGTDADYWGWRDRNNVATNKDLKTLSSHYFNPDYHVDELLFRQVIGTVTNSFYVKPWFMYDFFESRKDALALGLGILYGQAIETRATPGNDAPLGLEIDVNLLYENAGVFYVGVTWATLVPFDGLDLATDYGCTALNQNGRCQDSRIDSSWAMSLRGVFGVRF